MPLLSCLARTAERSTAYDGFVIFVFCVYVPTIVSFPSTFAGRQVADQPLPMGIGCLMHVC